MSTLVKGTRKPKAGMAQPVPDVALTEEAVRHYTAEEIEQKKLLPCKARWLKQKAYAREIPFTGVAGKLSWRLDQILAISRSFDSAPMSMGRNA